MCTKYVCRHGAIRWGSGKWVVVSTTLIEMYIGLEEIVKGKWPVYYRDTLLGHLDERELRIQDELGRLVLGQPDSCWDVLRKVSTMC